MTDNPADICKVDGCESSCEPQQNGRRGYCNKHYKKWRIYGDPTAGREHGQYKYSNVLCSIDECDARAISRGLCSRHYQRWFKYNDPLWGVAQHPPDGVVSVKQAARQLGVSTNSVYRYLDQGILLAEKKSLGGSKYRWDITPQALEAFEAFKQRSEGTNGSAGQKREPFEVPSGFLTIRQTQQALNVSASAVYQAINRGSLVGEKRNDRWVISQESVNAFKNRPTRISNISECKWENCERKSRSHSLCMKHYQQARYNSKHEHLIPQESRAPRCFIEECDEPQYAKGLCRNHDAQHKHGSTDPLIDGSVESDLGDQQSMGGRIKQHRIRQGLTMRDLATRTGLSRQRINQMEAQYNIRVSSLSKVASALNVAPDQLMPEFDSKPEEKVIVATPPSEVSFSTKTVNKEKIILRQMLALFENLRDINPIEVSQQVSTRKGARDIHRDFWPVLAWFQFFFEDLGARKRDKQLKLADEEE